MTSTDDAHVEERVLDRLQDLGLRQYEAQTLVNLLRLGTGTAEDVSRINDVPRTRVYEAAERLQEMGLIDIQYTTPRKFTVISKETIVRTLNTKREDAIQELAAGLDQIGPGEPQREQYGVWTVTGREATAARVTEFIGDAEDQIVFMTIDELLTDGQLDGLQEAANRGATVYIAGISEPVQDRIQETVPSAELFETLWEWEDNPAGTLLVTDEETALVSALVDGADDADEIEETAIWGAGDRNSLVVVLRAIFTWRLGDDSPA